MSARREPPRAVASERRARSADASSAPRLPQRARVASRALRALTVAAVRGLAWVVARLPVRWVDRAGAGLGWVWYRLIPIRRRVARENVRRALGDEVDRVEHIVAGMYRHLGLHFVELLRLAGRPPEAAWDGVRVEGLDHLEAALAHGRGVVLITAHLGHWEVLVRLAARFDRRLSIVTRRLRSPVAEAVWRGLRMGGARLIAADGGARTIHRALRDNQMVGFVLDQHAPPGEAVWVPFFGRPAATASGPARLVRLTGAVVLPVFTRRVPDAGPVRHEIRIDEPLPWPSEEADPVLAATAGYVRAIEAAIAASPEQWLWIHRRWKTPPESIAGRLVEGRSAVGRRGR